MRRPHLWIHEQVLIQTAMENVLEGRTSSVVAPSFITIQDADKIIVMNHGDVVETGRHQITG